MAGLVSAIHDHPCSSEIMDGRLPPTLSASAGKFDAHSAAVAFCEGGKGGHDEVK